MGKMPSEEIGIVSFLQVGGESDPEGWVFSTAATVHVCNSRDKFENYCPVSGKHVTHIVGHKIDVAGIGSLTLRLTSGQKITLQVVVHCPTFITNLLSVGSLSDQGFDVTFGGQKTMIYKNKKFVGNGCIREGLYHLNVENDNNSGAEGPSA